VTKEFGLKNQQYGWIEASFNLSFAFGSLFWGFLVDRVSVRYVYPIGLAGWSLMGFLTGWAQDYSHLIACRAMLGFFESAHWPCGLKVTQVLLSQQGRSLGNSVLQSGTSIGAILTPLIMLAVLTPEPGSWRFGFQAIAVAGSLWVFAWLVVVRDRDLAPLPRESDSNRETVRIVAHDDVWQDLWTRRFLLVVIMVIAINTMWQVLRGWLPKILLESYHYDEKQTLLFNSIWFAATDVGCFMSGLASLMLARNGFGIKWSRMIPLLVCVTAFSTLMLTPWLGSGMWMLAVFLLAGMGGLGIFPIYYSFSQDVSPSHQGKVTAVASTLAWIASSGAQVLFGWFADKTGSFLYGLMVVGALPAIPVLLLAMFWPNDSIHESRETTR
jgi:ACS family hexuronate transporter-like MFS transporter